ncbi:MAG TPA: hypothetical protein VGD71_11195 [Kribbella sp.]
MSAFELLAILAVSIPFVAVVALALHLAARRRDLLKARAYGAAQLGWYPAPPSTWLVEVAAGLFQRGRAGEMVTGGFRDRGVCVLDYSYTTTSTNGQGQTISTNHDCHLVALNVPVALPPLTLDAESKLARLTGRDLELESKAFNDAFRITCADNRYASAVLHPRMMEWMLMNPGLRWQLAGNALVSWGPGLWTLPDMLARLEAMNGVIDRIPPFVLRDYGHPVY